jgi:hypothetical protein
MMIIIRALHWVLQSRYWPPQNGFRCCRNHNVISIESIFDGDSPQYQRSIRVLNKNLQLQSGPWHNILLCCQNRYETWIKTTFECYSAKYIKDHNPIEMTIWLLFKIMMIKIKLTTCPWLQSAFASSSQRKSSWSIDFHWFC